MSSLLEQTVTIPTIPEALVEAEKLAADPEASLVSIADVIEKDPAIATQALRIANAPQYGLSHPVSSVRMTCVILGFDSLLNLIRQAAVLQLFPDDLEKGEFDCKALWDHSFLSALAARYLAMGIPDQAVCPETAYTCGLLHHVGKVILLDQSRAEFERCVKESTERRVPLRQVQRDMLGFTDADVLYRLAELWSLGDDVGNSAREVDTYVEGEPGLVWSRIARAADGVARDVAGQTPAWHPDPGYQEALAKLEVDDEFYDVVCGAVGETAPSVLSK